MDTSKISAAAAQFNQMVSYHLLKRMYEGTFVPGDLDLYSKLAETPQFYKQYLEQSIQNTSQGTPLPPVSENSLNVDNTKLEVKDEYVENEPRTLKISPKIEEETSELLYQQNLAEDKSSDVETVTKKELTRNSKKSNNQDNLSDLVKTYQYNSYYGRAVLEQFYWTKSSIYYVLFQL